MWVCSQLGAREHYAVPRALRRAGRLDTLYADFWAGPVTRSILEQSGKLKLAGKAFRSLAARYHPELEKTEGGNGKAEIVSWNFRALWWEAMLRRKQKPTVSDQASVGHGPHHGFIEVGRRFATCVREDLKRSRGLNSNSILFAYDTGALETLEWCRERGVKCILNQMDPNRVEMELVRAEEKQWPGWALEAVQVPEEYFIRREREWVLADRIMVNSQFCREALVKQGVAAEKLVVVPLCYEADETNRKPEIGNRKSEQPIRVLFLGQVILRKGIQYLLAAARQLERENIHFDVVGPIGISREAMATAPDNVTFHGRTGRDQAADWYRRSHLFVLPTLSDGFAITQLEAMAHGLPVIATPCCGDVVSDGVDGFIVASRDAGALARAFQRYLARPDLLPSQSAAALMKAGQFTLDRLANKLHKVENALIMKSRN